MIFLERKKKTDVETHCTWTLQVKVIPFEQTNKHTVVVSVNTETQKILLIL